MGDFGYLLKNKKRKNYILKQFGDTDLFLNGLMEYMYNLINKRKLDDIDIVNNFCFYIDDFALKIDKDKINNIIKRCRELKNSLNKNQKGLYNTLEIKLGNLLVLNDFDKKSVHDEQINIGRTIDIIIENNNPIIFDLLNNSEIAKFMYHDGQLLIDKVYNRFKKVLQSKDLYDETLKYLEHLIFCLLSLNKNSNKVDKILIDLDSVKKNLNNKEQHIILRNLKDNLYILKYGKLPDKTLKETGKIIRNQYNIHINFGAKALEEARNLKSCRINGSKKIGKFEFYDNPIKDFRDKKVITIDSSFKSAYDDAISLEKIDDGYLLGIYITDVCSFIDVNSELGIHAKQRCESIYLENNNQGTITMFPEDISKNFFSLNSLQDRQVVAYMFKFSKNYDFIGCEYTNALINVNHNYTYESIDKIMINDTNYDMIYELMKMTDSLKKEYNLNYHLMKEKIKNISSNTGSDIVTSSMIFLNSYIAKLFEKRGYPLIYRINESVTDENILNSRLDKFVKGYSKSYYSAHPGNHVVTNSVYCHITNPIRNYPSFLNQYLFEYLCLDTNKVSEVNEFINYWQSVLPSLVNQINRKMNENRNYVEIMKTLKK